MIQFGLAIFLAAFLLFQVQPILAQHILPRFGGTPNVWSACLLFFQSGLLLGYAYAHFLQRVWGPRRQALVHSVVLLASLTVLPIRTHGDTLSRNLSTEVVAVWAILGVAVGVPFFLLSSCSPLMQHWFSRRFPGRSPYRLYALSNLASLAGLLSYPLFMQAYFTLKAQGVIWSCAYVLFVAVSWYCAVTVSGSTNFTPNPADARRETPAPLRNRNALLWLLLPACGSVILLATTNQMCQSVAPVPFLWVLPLSLYLLTFMICFDREQWYVRRVYVPLLFVAAGSAAYLLWYAPSEEDVGLPFQIGVYTLVLFICCMNCHGELYRRRPPASRLTLFYLLVAAGGVLGALFVNFAAPLVFDDYWEFQLGILATIVLCGYCLFSDYKARPRRRGIVLTLAWGPAVAAVTAALVLPIFAEQQGRLSAERNFYGVLSVYEEGRGTAHRYRSLWHGHTLHGDQYLSEEFRAFPTTYYGPDSGVSVALEWHPKRFAPSSDPEECEAGCLRIGVVGLGAGTVATYGWQGDELYFYEINPAIVRVAEQRFYYLKDTSAAYTVILGDARVSLQRELDERGSRQFDVLVVDAFNDAGIPVHLLTREAFALYWSHLRPDGILAVHVSNLYLDLTPLIRGLAEEAGKEAFYVYNEADEDLGTSDADWVLVTTNQDFLEDEDVQFYSYDWPRDETLIWTDDFVNVVALIQR